MLHRDISLSKFSLAKYLESLLQQYSPWCANKWDVLDPDRKLLFRNSQVQNLFKQYNYIIYSTGANSPSQDGPVEQAHCKFSDGIKSCLIGTGLPIAYWLFAFFMSYKFGTHPWDYFWSHFWICK